MELQTLLALIKELGVGTLLGTIVGWSLTQCGQWMTTRRDRRKALSKTLAALLEIRHLMLSLPHAVDVLAKITSLPPEGETALKTILGGWLLPTGENLGKRYDACVDAVSELNPVLSFQLRSKDLLFPWLHRLRHMAIQSGDVSAQASLVTVEGAIMSEYRKTMDELVKAVAWRVGVREWWKARRILKEAGPTLPAAIEEQIKRALAAQHWPNNEASKSMEPPQA